MRQGYKTHVAAEKKKSVAEISKLMAEYPIVGIVNFENLPSQQLNVMRKQMRTQEVVMKMTKSSLIKLALEKTKASKAGIEHLEKYLTGLPAVLLTKKNPFALFKLIKKSKSKAPAKAGQTVPSDINVSAGPTSFAPGPIISELASFGIKTKVEGGKLAIQQDTVIAKAGTLVTDKLASMLLRLGIEPMEIGLDLAAIYENGTIFTKSVLDVDEDKFKESVYSAARNAFNLSVEIAYPNKDNIIVLVTKAARETKSLASSANIVCKDTIGDILGKANNQMLSLKSALKI